jgi:hypothetical protein
VCLEDIYASGEALVGSNPDPTKDLAFAVFTETISIEYLFDA